MGISRAEFARRDGCDRSLVSRAARDGRLTIFADGSLDSSLVGTAWRRGNEGRDSVEFSPAAMAERIVVEEGHAPYSKAEAERIKQNYLALLRQLEYDIATGIVVRRADEVAKVAAQYAKVKSRLLPLGSEIAPRLAPKTNMLAVEIKEEIDAGVWAALDELAGPPDTEAP